MRRYEALFNAGRCILCGQPRTIAGQDVHAELHLSDGSATVVVDFPRGQRRERVIPMPAEVVELAAAFKPRPMDPKMKSVVRAALKKASHQ